MPNPVTVYAVSVAQSRITQAQGSSGNRMIIQRDEVKTPLGVRQVPSLTGNAFRTRSVREPGFRWLIEQAGLNERLTKPEAYFLLRGGAEYVGNGGRESLQDIVDLARVSPLCGLLGGVTPKQMFAGSLNCDSGVLVCEENRFRLPAFVPPGSDVSDCQLPPASDFTTGYQYTRGGSEKATAGMFSEQEDGLLRFRAGGTPPGESKDKSNQMIYSGESIMPGAVFVHRYCLAHPKRLEVGALLWSLRLWVAYGNSFGGMGRVGHGHLRSQFHFPEEYLGADEEYCEHALKHKDEFAAWLRRAFGVAEEKPAKAAKSKKGDKAVTE
jgi:hypothetical protein